jgi:hypothetical protein
MGCQSERIEDDYVARVYNRYLTRAQLADFIPPTASRDDSLKRARVYINSWVKEQVVLEKAAFNLTEDDDRFQSKLDAYLNDLMIFEYEQQLVRQTLDTAVTEEQMRVFYAENSKNFILKDHVVRARILMIPEGIEDVERVIRKFRDYSENDSLEIQKFVADNSLFFQDQPTEWIFVKDLLDQVPINFDYFEKQVKLKNFFDKEQGGIRYLLYVTEYMIRDSESPFELERDRIRSIIINTRKQTLLEEMRDRLFQKALDSDEIEIKS